MLSSFPTAVATKSTPGSTAALRISASRAARREHGDGEFQFPAIQIKSSMSGSTLSVITSPPSTMARTVANFAQFWCDASEREHVIGKGITRFHAVYWLAMLLSAGFPLPTRILVHGYVTVDGKKIGKSAGNAIDPVPLAKALGGDALRYYLLRHIRSTEDGDFSQERCVQAYGSELADQLGNLAHRTLSMIGQYCGGIIPAPVGDRKNATELMSVCESLPGTVKAHLEGFVFHEALTAVWAFISTANKYVAQKKPWALAKLAANPDNPEIATDAQRELHNCLWDLAVSLFVIGQCLAPLLPSTSSRLLKQLGIDGYRDDLSGYDVAGNTINTDQVLFPKLQ